jgi:hypothetical protein
MMPRILPRAGSSFRSWTSFFNSTINEYHLASALLSIALWVTSLFLPAVWTGAPENTDFGDSGLVTLAFGWMEVFYVDRVGRFVALAWFANPLLLSVWILDSVGSEYLRKPAMILASTAVLLCAGYIYRERTHQEP